MLNFIWAGFFLVAFAAALCQSLLLNNQTIWTDLVNAVFSSSKTAFNISLNLTGILCLWLGLLKIAEKAGLTEALARLLQPLFRRIFPEVPAGHPALSSIVMNMSANILGLDNAATPMGLKAMGMLMEARTASPKLPEANICSCFLSTLVAMARNGT